MKFPLIALAGALASANASVKNIKLGGARQLRRGDPTTEALLQKAVPFKKTTRQLEDANENQVDGSYSISFGKCVDIKTKSDDLFNENIVDQVQSGNALSLKSYVLFYACKDSTGYGCSENGSDVYMVDLPTYLSVVGMKQANQRSDYCEQCERNQEYCAATEQVAQAYGAINDADEDEEDSADQETAEEDIEYETEDGLNEDQEEYEEQEEVEEVEEVEDAADEEVEEEVVEEVEEQEEQVEEQVDEEEQQEQEGPGRKLKQQIDCNKCDTLQCFAKDSTDDAVASQAAGRDYLDAYVAAWIEEIANCKETSEFINGQPVYIGPICSDYADTFEIGAFLDEDCTIHTKLASFDSIAIAEQANYSVDVAGYAINSLKTAFYEPMTCESREFAEGNEQEENDDESNEMNDYCKQLFEGDAINFGECAASEEEEQQGEANDAYSWYSYDMEDADEIEEACAKVVSFNGKYTNYYDSAASGSVHTRSKRGSLVKSASTGLSGGVIATIVLVCAVVAGVAVSVLKNKKVSASSLNEPMYQGGQMS